MSSVKPQIKRTYGSRAARAPIPTSSPRSSDTFSSPVRDTAMTGTKRKRPLVERLSANIPAPPAKKPAYKKAGSKQKALTQLHFSLDTSILRTCTSCRLSYTRGAPDDEALHKAHCAHVQRGMEWGREEEKEKLKAGVEEVVEGVVLSSGERGRVVVVRTSTGGKIGHKLSVFLETINLALSAPPLTAAVLQTSKAYLFLVPTGRNAREKIVGCAVAQPISTAMEVVASISEDNSDLGGPKTLVHVDGNLYCKPQRLPTPLGIPRLFVSASHRRQGVAHALLNAAARTFVHGCMLEPSKGQIAFSQPTSLGRAVMEKWGGGGVRVFEE